MFIVAGIIILPALFSVTYGHLKLNTINRGPSNMQITRKFMMHSHSRFEKVANANANCERECAINRGPVLPKLKNAAVT
jgi:hypothetical protein